MIEVLLPCWRRPLDWSEAHPDIRIDWEARSLQGFADHPIRNLAEEFDLLVLDHPFMGTVAKGGYLVPLDNHISSEVLSTYGTKVWALHTKAISTTATSGRWRSTPRRK